VVGSVTITGNNCNDLSLQYNLSDIGLGSGTKHLERLFSLETAGYVCRDLEARIDTRNPTPPAPPAIEVENRSLAFVRGEAIFTSALDGSEPVMLLQEGTQPAWSPDGTRLAFTRPADNSLAKWQLCIAQADGTGIRCATGGTDGNVVGVPSWSPDGTMVAFSVFVYCNGGECGNGGYFTSLSLLDTSTMEVQTLDTPPVWSASWSPDGRKIAIAIFGAGTYGRGALGVVNEDGSGLEILANSFGSYSVHQVAWSPDGGRLALTLNDEDACPWYCDTAIGVINADGTQLKVLDKVRTSDQVYFWTPPVWSPDGVSLAYTVSRGGDCYLYHVSCNEIALVNVASGQVGRLLSPGAYPSWQP
jgi:Tol biopolymer transport system component